jgi:hypothetical protein
MQYSGYMHQGKKRIGSYETGYPEKKKVDQIVFKTG